MVSIRGPFLASPDFLFRYLRPHTSLVYRHLNQDFYTGNIPRRLTSLTTTIVKTMVQNEIKLGPSVLLIHRRGSHHFINLIRRSVHAHRTHITRYIVIAITTSRGKQTTLGTRAAKELTILLTNRRVGSVLAVRTSTLMGTTIRRYLARRHRVLYIEVRAHVAYGATIYRPYITVITLTSRHMVTPTVRFTRNVRVNNTVMTRTQVASLVSRDVLVQITREDYYGVVNNGTIFRQRVNHALRIRQLMSFILGMLIRVTTHSALRRRTRRLRARITMLFLAKYRRRFAITSVVRRLKFILVGMRRRDFPLQGAQDVNRGLVGNSVLFTVLHGFESMTYCNHVRISLSFTMRLRSKLNHNRSLHTKYRVRRNIRLRKAKVVRAGTRIVRRYVSVKFFVSSLTATHRGSNHAERMTLPRMIFRGNVSNNRSHVLLSKRSEKLRTIFNLFETYTTYGYDNSDRNPRNLSKYSRGTTTQSLFRKGLSFSSGGLGQLCRFQGRGCFVRCFMFLFRGGRLRVLVRVLFSFSRSAWWHKVVSLFVAHL